MHAILDFLRFLMDAALEVMIWIIIAYAILSWLIAFSVVNLRNRMVYSASRLLESAARPLLRPIQRIVPPFGQLDLSPLIFILLLTGIERFLVPELFRWLDMLVGPRIVAT
jgi:YggT family protein